MKKFLVYLLAVMFVLSMGGTAFAAWTAGGTRAALTGASSAQLSPVLTSANPVYTIASGETLGLNDTITITLTGGATFVGTTLVTMGSNGTVDLGSGAGIAGPPNVSGGTAGSTTATWRVITGGGTAGVTTYTLNLGAVSNVNLTAATASVDLYMDIATSTGVTVLATRKFQTDTTAYLFSIAAGATVAVTPQSNVVLVSSSPAFTKFAAGAVAGTATTVTYTNNSTATTIPVSTVNAATKILFTLTGDFTGITSVSAASCTGSLSTGVQTGGTANFFLKPTGVGTAYASNTAAVAAGGAGQLVLAPVFTLNGTTAQAARSFSIKVENLGETAWSARTWQAATNLYTITRDGATRKALNIPNSANVDQGFIRIINTTSAAGVVYGTMYKEDGTLIGTASTVIDAALGAYATKILTPANLETTFGAWTGKAILIVDSELASMEVYCLIRSNNQLNNMSPVAPN